MSSALRVCVRETKPAPALRVSGNAHSGGSEFTVRRLTQMMEAGGTCWLLTTPPRP